MSKDQKHQTAIVISPPAEASSGDSTSSEEAWYEPDELDDDKLSVYSQTQQQPITPLLPTDTLHLSPAASSDQRMVSPLKVPSTRREDGSLAPAEAGPALGADHRMADDSLFDCTSEQLPHTEITGDSVVTAESSQTQQLGASTEPMDASDTEHHFDVDSAKTELIDGDSERGDSIVAEDITHATAKSKVETIETGDTDASDAHRRVVDKDTGQVFDIDNLPQDLLMSLMRITPNGGEEDDENPPVTLVISAEAEYKRDAEEIEKMGSEQWTKLFPTQQSPEPVSTATHGTKTASIKASAAGFFKRWGAGKKLGDTSATDEHLDEEHIDDSSSEQKATEKLRKAAAKLRIRIEVDGESAETKADTITTPVGGTVAVVLDDEAVERESDERRRYRVNHQLHVSCVSRRVRVKGAHKKKELEWVEEVQKLKNAHEGAIWCCEFSRKGDYMASGGQSGILRIWTVCGSTADRRRWDPALKKDVAAAASRAAAEAAASGSSPVPPVPTPFVKRAQVASSDVAPTKTGGVDPSEARRGSLGDVGSMSDASHFGLEPPPPATAVLNPVAYRELHGHQLGIIDLSWSAGDFVLSASMDQTVCLWHTSRARCLCMFQHADFVTSVDFHPTQDYLFLTGSFDSRLRLWNILDHCVLDWVQLPDSISAATFSPNGKLAVVGLLDGSCVFYRTDGMRLSYMTKIECRNAQGKYRKGTKVTGFKYRPAAAYAYHWRKDAGASERTEDRHTTTHRRRDSRERRKTGRRTAPMPFASSTHGAEDGVGVGDYELERTVTSQSTASATYGEHGSSELLVTTNDSRMRLYNVSNFEMKTKFKGHSNCTLQIEANWSPDGQLVICGSDDGYVYVWRHSPELVQSFFRSESNRNDAYEYFRLAMKTKYGGSGGSVSSVALFAPTRTLHYCRRFHVKYNPLLHLKPVKSTKTSSKKMGHKCSSGVSSVGVCSAVVAKTPKVITDGKEMATSSSALKMHVTQSGTVTEEMEVKDTEDFEHRLTDAQLIAESEGDGDVDTESSPHRSPPQMEERPPVERLLVHERESRGGLFRESEEFHHRYEHDDDGDDDVVVHGHGHGHGDDELVHSSSDRSDSMMSESMSCLSSMESESMSSDFTYMSSRTSSIATTPHRTSSGVTSDSTHRKTGRRRKSRRRKKRKRKVKEPLIALSGEVVDRTKLRHIVVCTDNMGCIYIFVNKKPFEPMRLYTEGGIEMPVSSAASTATTTTATKTKTTVVSSSGDKEALSRPLFKRMSSAQTSETSTAETTKSTESKGSAVLKSLGHKWSAFRRKKG